jgi:hypothetical protein
MAYTSPLDDIRDRVDCLPRDPAFGRLRENYRPLFFLARTPARSSNLLTESGREQVSDRAYGSPRSSLFKFAAENGGLAACRPRLISQ